MKITLTGSLGHISRPLAEILIQQGHTVTIISSNPVRQEEIEALGATAAIGKIEDVDFLVTAFAGADLAYCMEPPPDFFKKDLDNEALHMKIAQNYVQAIETSGIKRLIHLSSIGAHRSDGVGMLSYHYNVEKILNTLDDSIAITFMRPVGFYYNLYAYIPSIQSSEMIVSNFGGDQKEPWVSPLDIATAIAREIHLPMEGRKVVYVASDEISCNEIATVLGEAIGKTNLKWIQKTETELINAMIGHGMNPTLATGLAKMNTSRGNGILYEDYYQNRPELGNVKITEFAKEFAASFKNQKKQK